MGDEMDKPVMGVVVPQQTATALTEMPEVLAEPLPDDLANATYFGGKRVRVRTRGPGKGVKGKLGEALFDLRMVLDDVSKAINEIQAIKDAGHSPWKEADLLIEPLARVGHAERTCASVVRKVGRGE